MSFLQSGLFFVPMCDFLLCLFDNLDHAQGQIVSSRCILSAKEKDKEKTRSQHHIRVSRAIAGHVASGSTRRVSVGKVTCKPWRKFRVLLSSVAPSAATAPAAAKTSASVQEINDENEPGRIFVVMGESVASVTRHRCVGCAGVGQWVGVNGVST